MRSTVVNKEMNLPQVIDRPHFVWSKSVACKECDVVESTIAIFVRRKKVRMPVTRERDSLGVLAREHDRSPAHAIHFGQLTEDRHQSAPCCLRDWQCLRRKWQDLGLDGKADDVGVRQSAGRGTVAI